MRDRIISELALGLVMLVVFAAMVWVWATGDYALDKPGLSGK